MRMICGVWVVVCGLIFGVLAEDASKTKTPELSVEVETSQMVPATEGYVIFLLEQSGGTMGEAKSKFDQRLQEISAQLSKSFPQCKLDVFTVNIGTKNYNDYRAVEGAMLPTVSKILLFTTPPDEALAVDLLDAGVKVGLTPFCANSREGMYGAVHYGVRGSDEIISQLYLKGRDKMRRDADQLAALMCCRVVRMSDVSRYFPRNTESELRFRDFKFALPAEFCGTDAAHIQVTVKLRGDFDVIPAI